MATAEEPVKRTRTNITVGAVREEVEALIEASTSEIAEHKDAIDGINATISAYRKVLALMDKSGE